MFVHRNTVRLSVKMILVVTLPPAGCLMLFNDNNYYCDFWSTEFSEIDIFKISQ